MDASWKRTPPGYSYWPAIFMIFVAFNYYGQSNSNVARHDSTVAEKLAARFKKTHVTPSSSGGTNCWTEKSGFMHGETKMIAGCFGYNLVNRSVVTLPYSPADTKEEGKIVVDITVDKKGNVIAANPNGRGTTTNSALLKAKAKRAALATKFDVNDQYEEQNGTITIIFSFD